MPPREYLYANDEALDAMADILADQGASDCRLCCRRRNRWAKRPRIIHDELNTTDARRQIWVRQMSAMRAVWAGASSADHQFEVLWPFDFGKRVAARGVQRASRDSGAILYQRESRHLHGRRPGSDGRSPGATIDFWAERTLGGAEAADAF